MGNKKHPVQIFFDSSRERYQTDPPVVMVNPGDTVIFTCKITNVKIGFPYSGILNFSGWATIRPDKNFEALVDSDAQEGDYYYSVMCKHTDGRYWYAEGESCPGMRVG